MPTPVSPSEPFDPLADLLNDRYEEIDLRFDDSEDRLDAIEAAIESLNRVTTYNVNDFNNGTTFTGYAERRGQQVTLSVSALWPNPAAVGTNSYRDIGYLAPIYRLNPPGTVFVTAEHAAGTAEVEILTNGIIRSRFWKGTTSSLSMRFSATWHTNEAQP